MATVHGFVAATVTLTRSEADRVSQILRDYARSQWDAARRTKSAAIREAGTRNGNEANDLEAMIVARMFNPPEGEGGQ